jgi:hypothetical protein
VAIAAVIEFQLRDLLTKPFYSDEAWRAYDITLGPGFFSHLNDSGGPLAAGWLAIEDVSRLLVGNTEAGLRGPMFLALPVLGVATYLLARTWLGVAVSFCVAALLLVNPFIVNNALQLKSYSYEGIWSVATIALILLVQRTTWRPVQLLLLYAAVGLTAVFSLPNLFILAPLLLLDLIRAIRSRDRLWLRIAGEALAGLIALAHYVLFIRPQAGVVGTTWWKYYYAPHQFGPLVHFALRGLASFDPFMVTGVATVEQQLPTYTLPPLGHDLLAAGILVLLAAGIWAAAADAAARTTVVALGGALVLELIASAVQRWPFGMTRLDLFMLPLIYVLGGIGAVWLARAALGGWRTRRGRLADRGRVIWWWRVPAFGVFLAVLAAIVVPGGTATARTLRESYERQGAPTEFSNIREAVAQARRLAVPGDVAIVRTDRTPPFWYGEGWLYYMDSYQGYPASIARLPRVAASNAIAVGLVTPAAVGGLMAAHPHARTVFLVELNVPRGLPRSLHDQALQTLRRYGYCPAHEYFYAFLGDMTVLDKGACRGT